MKELKFIHITKTGGTYIEDIGIKNGKKWGRFDKEYNIGFTGSDVWHTKFTLLSKSFFFFCISSTIALAPLFMFYNSILATAFGNFFALPFFWSKPAI